MDNINSAKANYTYDKLNCITQRSVTNGATYLAQYGYAQGAAAYGSNATTPLINAITQGSGANALNFAYTYDNRGNITSETRNGVTTTYEYDALGQLTRVNDPNDPTGSAFGTTWIYTYDRGGNILNKSAYVYTTGTVGTVVRSWAYGYDDPNWKDKLTSFDGHTITYDAIGNPLNDGEWTYEWQAGRQLKRMTNLTTGVVMEFTYNHAGIRTKKVKKENGVAVETTEYILNGKQVVGLIHTDHTTSTIDELQFFYDAQGRVSMLKYEDALYSYVHNLQGDIVGILGNEGTLYSEYKYDAWGKLFQLNSLMMLKSNPFKYRGYILDDDTSLYYLRSRYYSVIVNRYVILDIDMSANLYGYCQNSPIVYSDSNGTKESDAECYFFGTGSNKEGTYHVTAIYILPDNYSMTSDAFSCDKYFLVSYHRDGKGRTIIRYCWDENLQSYLLNEYGGKDDILERSVYIGTCNLESMKKYIDYSLEVAMEIGNYDDDKHHIKAFQVNLDKSKHFYLKEREFIEYDIDQANCSIFAMCLTMTCSCNNPTIQYIIDTYSGKSCVYTNNFYWTLEKEGPHGSLWDMINMK